MKELLLLSIFVSVSIYAVTDSKISSLPDSFLEQKSCFSIQTKKQFNNLIKLKKDNPIKKIDYALISHSNLIVLEYFKEDDFQDYTEITNHGGYTSSCKLYKIPNHLMNKKYNKLVGQEVFLNDHLFNRTQSKQKIIDIVVVNDRFQSDPYYAAVIDTTGLSNAYYAWVSSSQTNIEQFGEPKTKDYNYGDQLDTNYNHLIDFYKSSDIYKNMEEKIEKEDSDTYNRIDVIAFQSTTGDYFVLENKLIGVCEFLTDNQLVLYKKINGNYEVLANSTIDQEVIDLIDINNDGMPELLTGEFSESSIFKVVERELQLLKTVSWSFDGCPC